MPLLTTSLALLALGAPAAADAERERCLLDALARAESRPELGARPVAELLAECRRTAPPAPAATPRPLAKAEAAEPAKPAAPGACRRADCEREARDNPYALLAHHRNYFLPVSYNRHPNHAPYVAAGDDADASLEHLEAKFQISVKAPLWHGGVLTEDDAIYFAFTGTSYWQLYDSERSAPFRNTDYMPELFYQGTAPDWRLGAWQARVLQLGLAHQSNGRSQPYSRSWNRVYANLAFGNDAGWLVGFKPWYRLPEDEKEDPAKAKGDDNRDIDDYLGFMESYVFYSPNREHKFGLVLRDNLRSHNRLGGQLDWSFPLPGTKRVRGYAQYYHGYGESLIDYNASVERIGLGFLLTDAQ